MEQLFLPIVIPLFFILWTGLSVFWSESTVLAITAWIKIVEGYSLYLYVLLSQCSTWNTSSSCQMFHVEQSHSFSYVPRGTFFSATCGWLGQCSTWNTLHIMGISLMLGAFFQSLVAIAQFIHQKSLGLTLFGESIFSVNDIGVAKVIIHGETLVRSYGLFPHPNVLGGFLALSLLITMTYPLLFPSKMFHVEQKMSVWFYRFVIFIQMLALFLTFSKAALLAFILGFGLFLLRISKTFHVEQFSFPSNVPRGTLDTSPRLFWKQYIKKMFHVEHWVVVTGILLGVITLFAFNLKFFLVQPWLERLWYLQALEALFPIYFFQGVGIGQFVFSLQQFFDEKLLIWQFQPLHNVFLLIFSEGGVVGLFLYLGFFMYAFWKNVHNVPRGTISSFLMFSLLMVVTIGMLFDHYFWDIQQGQLLAWVILALAVARK